MVPHSQITLHFRGKYKTLETYVLYTLDLAREGTLHKTVSLRLNQPQNIWNVTAPLSACFTGFMNLHLLLGTFLVVTIKHPVDISWYSKVFVYKLKLWVYSTTDLGRRQGSSNSRTFVATSSTSYQIFHLAAFTIGKTLTLYYKKSFKQKLTIPIPNLFGLC